MEEINKDSYQEKVHQSDKPVILDFYSDMCGPCKQLAPELEKVAEKYDGKAHFYKINIMGNQEIFAEHGVQSVPTLIIFKDGKPVADSLGFKDEAGLSEWLDQNL